MPAFKATVKTITEQEWTIEGGGTAEEAIGKTAEEPTAPSETKSLTQSTIGKSFLVSAWTGLPPATAKITALTLHVYAKVNTTESESLNMDIENAAKAKLLEFKPKVKTTSSWLSGSLTTKQCEELTKADIEKLACEGNVNISGKKSFIYEIYLSGTYTEATALPHPLVRASQAVARASAV